MVGASACPPGPDGQNDPPVTNDAGATEQQDAGNADAGGSSGDDGGTTAGDAGGETGDAGTRDAGSETVDAGPWEGPEIDAGVLDPTQGEWDDSLILPGFAGEFSLVTALAKAPNGDVFAAGDFVMVDGTPARSIARWDGMRWVPVGDGLPWPANALVIGADGTVYAAGGSTGFFFSGGVVRWTGSAWQELATFDMPVKALLLDGNTLYAGGGFTNVDGALAQNNTGVAVDGIAKLDGDTWSAVGDPPGTWSVNTILKLDASTVCIGGFASSSEDPPPMNDHVACFNGMAWSQLGDGLPGEVFTLVKGPDDAVYAGGTFVYFDTTTLVAQTGLAKLENGTWSPWGGGVGGGFVDTVRTIVFNAQGEALVGGSFAGVNAGTNDPVRAPNIARRDVNGEWHALGDGVSGRQGGIGGGPLGVHAILPEADGTIWIGGMFNRAGDVITINLVKWGGSGFVPVKDESRMFNGVQGFIDGLAQYGHGGVVAGGLFGSIGGTVTDNIALFRDGRWEALGPGLNGLVSFVMTTRNGDILAGGDFSGTPDDVLFSPGLARWNRVTEAWESMGEFDGPVLAAVEDSNGVLYVAGQFTHIGLDSVDSVARWNPNTSAFEQVGAGLQGPAPMGPDDFPLAARVLALAVAPDDTLYAGGIFERSDTTRIKGLAKLTGGAWEQVANGLERGMTVGSASTLLWTRDGLLVGGNFSELGVTGARSLALWDGTAWHGFGEGLAPSTPEGTVIVNAIAPLGDGFFVTGIIDNAGSNSSVGHIAYWDGAAWHPLGRGLNDLGETMVLVGDALYVGGPFTMAGDFPSEGMARWVMPQAAP